MKYGQLPAFARFNMNVANGKVDEEIAWMSREFEKLI
jgi:hypothetical protein